MAITLKARRSSGDQYTNEDNIELVFDYSGEGKMHEAFVTIEQVSGVTATHGGGAPAGEWLHYKAYDLHADDAGYIDYTNTNVQVHQKTKGTSVIKVKCKYITKAQHDAFKTALDDWNEEYLVETVLKDVTSMFTQPDADAPEQPASTFTTLTTGNITLTWGDDSFV